MASGELEPIVRTGPVLSEVAAEMSEIFAEAGVGPPVVGLRRPAAVSALRPDRGNSQAVTWLVAVVAGLVGLGAGAFVIRTQGPSVQAQAKAPAQPQAPPQSPPQVVARPPIALAEAAPAPAVDKAGPGPAAPAARTAPASSSATARSRAQFRLKLARLGTARPAQAKAAVRSSREPMPMAQPASCEQDAEGETCRGAVIQADRHLRAVYENAIRRGVSRGVLVDYRDRWADLRDRNTDDPTRLIESYGALAYDLGRETADEQDEGVRQKGRSGLKALADLLLPWR